MSLISFYIYYYNYNNYNNYYNYYNYFKKNIIKHILSIRKLIDTHTPHTHTHTHTHTKWQRIQTRITVTRVVVYSIIIRKQRIIQIQRACGLALIMCVLALRVSSRVQPILLSLMSDEKPKY